MKRAILGNEWQTVIDACLDQVPRFPAVEHRPGPMSGLHGAASSTRVDVALRKLELGRRYNQDIPQGW